MFDPSYTTLTVAAAGLALSIATYHLRPARRERQLLGSSLVLLLPISLLLCFGLDILRLAGAAWTLLPAPWQSFEFALATSLLLAPSALLPSLLRFSVTYPRPISFAWPYYVGSSIPLLVAVAMQGRLGFSATSLLLAIGVVLLIVGVALSWPTWRPVVASGVAFALVSAMVLCLYMASTQQSMTDSWVLLLSSSMVLASFGLGCAMPVMVRWWSGLPPRLS